MRAGKRKAWLEKQPEEVRLYVLGLLGDPAVTYEEASRRLQAKFALKVPPSTLAYSRSLTVGQDEDDLQEAKQEAARFTEFIRQNPDMPEERLRKTWFYRRLASKEFRDGSVEPSKLVFLAQRERELELRERQIAAVEEQNRSKVRELEISQQKIAVAAGGLDGRDLYLRAAQDVLKKLQTYKELKPALALRREEIVGELAHAAEAFVKKVEAQA